MVKVEVIAIAEEVLKGYTLNSNASFLSLHLRKLGYSVSRHTALPDDAPVLEEAIKEASERSSLVITTGGLGPTSDDLTKRLLAKFFSSPLVFHEGIAEDLTKRYGKSYRSIKEQSTVPEKAHILWNRMGTAPGFIFTEPGKMVIALPGVPREMEEMFLLEVIPYLKKHLSLKKRLFVEELHFGILPELRVDEFVQKHKANDLEFGIYPSLGILHVTLSVMANNQKEADEKTRPLIKKIQQEFKDHLFEAGSGLIEEAVHQAFLEKGKTLAIAESCTGGAIAKRLTVLAGASDYFLGSVVSYSNEMKRDLLGVSAEILESEGALSQKAAEEMVRGLFARTSCDYALAVSGIAGPSGGSAEKPIGTVFVALAKRNGEMVSGKLQAKGRSRSGIIEYSSNFCLFSLWKYFTSEQIPFFQPS